MEQLRYVTRNFRGAAVRQTTHQRAARSQRVNRTLATQTLGSLYAPSPANLVTVLARARLYGRVRFTPRGRSAPVSQLPGSSCAANPSKFTIELRHLVGGAFHAKHGVDRTACALARASNRNHLWRQTVRTSATRDRMNPTIKGIPQWNPHRTL